MDNLLTSATPLLLAGLGALLTELSGALGVFIEGFMVLGSFFSWIFAVNSGSAGGGTLSAALLGALAGWGLARFVRVTKANPFIAGLALNLAAGGLTDYLSQVWFGTKGVLRAPEFPVPGPVFIPLIHNIPGIGKILSGQLPFTYIAWALVILGGVVIGKTPLGLHLRASGRSPLAMEERGLHPAWYREGAWAAAAFLACLAGASLSFRVGAYTPGGVAGRGWIALAAIYLGFRTVWGTAAAALVFALAEYAGVGLQGFGTVPATVLLGLPSALALLLYTLAKKLRIKNEP
jgi:simple sugar transport system permease protein